MNKSEYLIKIARNLFELAKITDQKEALKKLSEVADALQAILNEAYLHSDLGLELAEYISLKASSLGNEPDHISVEGVAHYGEGVEEILRALE